MLDNAPTRTRHLTRRQRQARRNCFVRMSCASMFGTLTLKMNTCPMTPFGEKVFYLPKEGQALPRQQFTCFGWNSGGSPFRLALPARQCVLDHNGWPEQIKSKSTIDWKITLTNSYLIQTQHDNQRSNVCFLHQMSMLTETFFIVVTMGKENCVLQTKIETFQTR